MKIFADRCKSVERDPRNTIHVASNFVTRAGYCGGVENVSCMAWHGNEAEALDCFAQALSWLFGVLCDETFIIFTIMR